MLLLLLCLSLGAVNNISCSLGCSQPCTSAYTCGACKEGYEVDNECSHCKLVDVYHSFSEENPLYVLQNGECIRVTNYIQKSGWLPESDNEIVPILIETPLTLNFDTQTKYDFGPCISRGEKQNRYRP
ncbi:protein kinase domain containing protein, partial [Entamoeba invadens IP1]